MPEKMAERTVRIAKLDPNKPETMDFDKAYQASLSQIHSGNAMEAIRTLPNSTNQHLTI